MFGTLGSNKHIYISLFNNKFYYDYVHFSQTCLFGREKHDAGVHWTPRDYSRVKFHTIRNRAAHIPSAKTPVATKFSTLAPNTWGF